MPPVAPTPPRHGAQSGQAIILIAFIMIGLLGALGLAIDGGGMLFLYRDMQNATDAAVVAATYARCTNATPANIVAAGLRAAADSGFNNDGVTNWVTVSNPPPAGAPEAGNNAFVHVSIRARKVPYFIQLVYRGPLEVNNVSVGRCRPAFNPANVGAIFGIAGIAGPGMDTGTTGCNMTVEFSGASVTVTGNIHSNTDFDPRGGGQSIVINNNVTYRTDIKPNNKVLYNGTNTQTTARPDPLASIYTLANFAPGGRFWNEVPSNLRTSITGNWKPNGTLEGLYYVTGDVDLIGPTFGARGATIIATGTIQVRQAGTLNYYSGTGSTGILFFSGADTSCVGNAIKYSGSGNSTGVLYAPFGELQFSHSDGTWVGALVGERVSFSGSRTTVISNPNILRVIPPQVEIAQ